MDKLSELADMLYGPGAPMQGLALTDDEAVTMMRARRHNTEYRVVRDWIWLDVDVTPAEQEKLSKTRRQPVVLYANSVVHDSRCRLDVGDFVRSTFLSVFYDEGFFQTWNTLYVLLGPGQRKRVALDTVMSII